MRAAGLSYGEWHDYCSRWPGGNSEAVIRRTWNSCNPHSIGYKTLLKIADESNPDWRRQYYRGKRQEEKEAAVSTISARYHRIHVRRIINNLN
jgi:hypothetical protein